MTLSYKTYLCYLTLPIRQYLRDYKPDPTLSLGLQYRKVHHRNIKILTLD